MRGRRRVTLCSLLSVYSLSILCLFSDSDIGHSFSVALTSQRTLFPGIRKKWIRDLVVKECAARRHTSGYRQVWRCYEHCFSRLQGRRGMPWQHLASPTHSNNCTRPWARAFGRCRQAVTARTTRQVGAGPGTCTCRAKSTRTGERR